MRFRGEHYEAEVNKCSLNMQAFTSKLNHRWKTGWRLSHSFEQDRNTVFVWERREVELEDQPTATAATDTPYSSIRHQPTTQATSSPRVA